MAAGWLPDNERWTAGSAGSRANSRDGLSRPGGILPGHLYDQAAFDPDYESEPLEFFIPMVERVFSKPVNSMYLKAMQD